MLHVTSAWQKSSRHKIAVISDLHFPRRDSHPKYLYEFLLHNPSDILLILGDFFEGYERTLDDFSEWHKRCLDLIHKRKTEEELRVIVIPGNHDQYLRDKRVLDHYVFGSLYRPHMVLDGHGGQRTFLTHGDMYDPKSVQNNDMLAYQAGESVRIARISLSQLYNYYVGSSDKRLKPSFEKRSHAELSRNIRKGIVVSATEHECNAVLCGHTHTPQPFTPVTKHTWLKYGNTGSFTGKLSTAMILTCDDRWRLVNWAEQRTKQGLDKLPHRDDENHALPYREQTEAEIHFHRALHKVWVSRRMIEQAQRTIAQIKEMVSKVEDMLGLQEEELSHALKNAQPEPAARSPGQGRDPAYILAAA